MAKTSERAPSPHLLAELRERLPRLLRGEGDAGIRVGTVVLNAGPAGAIWSPLPGHPTLELGLPPDAAQSRDRLASRLDDQLDDLAEIESCTAALVETYGDMAVLDEIGRSLPTLTRRAAVAEQIARLLAARLGGLGAVLLAHGTDLQPAAAWGGAATEGLAGVRCDALLAGAAVRVIDHGPLPEALTCGRPRQGASCVVDLPGPAGRVGAVLLARPAGPAYTSAEAKLLEVIAAQTGAYLHALAQAEALRAAEVAAHELRLAGEIQQALLPQAMPQVPGLDLAGRVRPARHVGGDCFDVLWDGCILTLLVADVSGHSVAAGLAMAMVRTALRLGLGQNLPPGELLAVVNRELTPDLLRSRLFVSLSVLALDPLSGEFTLASAGHLPLLHRRADGSIVRHEAEGPVLGLFEEAGFDELTGRLNDDETLLLLTDGVIEGRDATGRPLGLEGVEAVLARPLTRAAPLIDAVVRTAQAWSRAEAEDDLTLLAAVRCDPANSDARSA